jgi:FKBP-type peptidyl-prolyl cis-trans isomerase FkpA
MTHCKTTLKTLALALAMAYLPTALAADTSDDQKTLYTLGATIGKQISVFKLSPAELEEVKKGLSDAVLNKKLAVDFDAQAPKINTLAQSRASAGSGINKTAGAAFADKAAKEKGAEKTASGLVYLSLKEGTGASPAATDVVSVHYRGTLIDGKEFDSSYKRNAPAEFPLNGVVKCWTEGVQKMKVGGKARLICPSSIAYGDGGAPGGSIPPGSTLSFEIELLAIKAK